LDQILSTTSLDYKIFHVSQGEVKCSEKMS
jgi:hypothetical protein